MGSYAKKSPADESRWVCIYPSYINSKKTIAEGRKIPKEKAVEKPTCQEMMDIMKSAGFNVKVERKMYPRDQNRDWTVQGRLRVQLWDETGVAVNEKFPNRTALMVYLAEMIPKLKSRQSLKATAAGGVPDAEPTAAAGGKGKKSGKR